MSDDTPTGPFHLTIEADVRVANPARLGNPSDAQLGDVLADLIRRHAREAGLEITDPAAVRVTVSPGR